MKAKIEEGNSGTGCTTHLEVVLEVFDIELDAIKVEVIAFMRAVIDFGSVHFISCDRELLIGILNLHNAVHINSLIRNTHFPALDLRELSLNVIHFVGGDALDSEVYSACSTSATPSNANSSSKLVSFTATASAKPPCGPNPHFLFCFRSTRRLPAPGRGPA